MQSHRTQSVMLRMLEQLDGRQVQKGVQILNEEKLC